MLDPKTLTFYTLAQERSYTRAAEKLNMTQPAVSQHIAKLEEYYGQKLVRVVGRAVALTAAGEQVFHYAGAQIANERALREQLAHRHTGYRVGATLSIADYYMPQMLQHSDFESSGDFTIYVDNTATLLKKIQDGYLDCAFIEGIFDRSLFAYEEYRAERFTPVVGAGHPLAGRRVQLEELFSYPLILREEGSGTRAILENYLFQQNCSVESFRNCWEIGSFLLIKDLLKHHPAISFMYENVAKKEVEEGALRFLKIENYNLIHCLYFVYPKNALREQKIRELYEKMTK